jgi:hypothetical protein
MILRQSTLSRSPVVVKPCAFLVVAHLIIISTPDVAALYLVIIRECLRLAGWEIEVAPEDFMIRNLLSQFSHSESQTAVSDSRVKT